MTDPSNSRDGEKDAPEDVDPIDEDADPSAVDDTDVTESADDADTDEDDEGPVRDKPAASGKASRSGNPARAAEAEQGRSTRPVKPQRIGNRWAAPAMLTSAGIGLVWIVLYYVFANGENPIPVMDDLGDWNLIIGMGFIVAAFGFSMKWE
ncbi:MAG: cell division protein CrgA [Nocardioidaceae bacterium]